MSRRDEAIAAAHAKFDAAQRAADAAYAASDHGREAGETWRAAIRSAQETARTEHDAALRLRGVPGAIPMPPPVRGPRKYDSSLDRPADPGRAQQRRKSR
jgi:hypothetical protein